MAIGHLRSDLAAPAAILAADIAGYSRLMGADQAGTRARLKEYRRELIDPKNKQYRGRVVKTTGDGILIEFPSVVDAISCPVEIQQGSLGALRLHAPRRCPGRYTTPGRAQVCG